MPEPGDVTMTGRERRVLAALGALGAGCMATSTLLMGADLLDGVNQTFKVTGFILGAGGTGLSAIVTYYKGALTS